MSISKMELLLDKYVVFIPFYTKDGFGWTIGTADIGHKKKPQTMRVIIGDNVQIGANTAIGLSFQVLE